MSNAFPKAFAVWFEDLKIWDVRSTRLRITSVCRWPTKQIGHLCKVRFEVVPDSAVESGEVLLLDRVSFDEGKVHAGKRQETRMIQYRAKPGDIVVSKINARKKAVGIVPPGSDVGITIHFRSLLPDSAAVDPLFLWLALRSEFCVNQFDVETGGIGKGEISEERLLSIDVPLPPIETQQLILTQWRKTQDEIAAVQDKIKTIEAEIEERFFADLGLKTSVKVKPPKCFSVWWHDLLRWSVSSNQATLTGTDITKGKFPVVELGSILKLVQYGTSEKANNKGVGSPVLRMSNIKDGVLVLFDLKHIELPEGERQRLLLKDGDILFNRTNSKELVGKCAVFQEQGEFVFASYLIRVRADSQRSIPDYISFVINSQIGRKQIAAMSRQIIGQANINSQELRTLKIPLPPVNVQRQIMEELHAGRARIACEREVVRETARRIEADLETWLLGKKKVGAVKNIRNYVFMALEFSIASNRDGALDA